jgi:hypothetical protein
VAHAGKEEGARDGKGREELLGWARRGSGLPFLFLFLLSFLFYTQTFKPLHLNSNNFEFNPHK